MANFQFQSALDLIFHRLFILHGEIFKIRSFDCGKINTKDKLSAFKGEFFKLTCVLPVENSSQFLFLDGTLVI